MNPQPHHLTPCLGQSLSPLEQVSRPVQRGCQQSLLHILMALEKGSLNGPIPLVPLNSEAWKDR